MTNICLVLRDSNLIGYQIQNIKFLILNAEKAFQADMLSEMLTNSWQQLHSHTAKIFVFSSSPYKYFNNFCLHGIPLTLSDLDLYHAAQHYTLKTLIFRLKQVKQFYLSSIKLTYSPISKEAIYNCELLIKTEILLINWLYL